MHETAFHCLLSSAVHRLLMDESKSISTKTNSQRSSLTKGNEGSAQPSSEDDPLIAEDVSRGGKTIVWQDIMVSVPVQSSKETGGQGKKVVLSNVSGCAWPGEVLAIMGGSGAGKTTLMNILAHLETKGVESKGTVRVNRQILSKTEMRKMSAYVQQVDVFCGTLTVREQLTYSALLRMDKSYTKEEKLEKVETVIGEMNLIDCQDTLIGIPNRTKGISIGEKKRLAFACEVLTDPAILFCDEPTSGLDSFMASQVVTALGSLAKSGKTIISVIHQPSSTVFCMFDKVLFMANGHPAYHGPVKAICPFFDSMGLPNMRVPESFNPADHVISKLSISPETKDNDIKQIEFITEQFEQSEHGAAMREAVLATPMKGHSQKDTERQGYAVGFPTQLSVLFRRAFLTTLRDPLLLKVRGFQVLVTAVIIAVVNWQTEVRGPTIQNMEGVLYNTVRDMNFLFLFPSVNVITSELPVFMREHKARIYSVYAYYLAKSLAELPQYTILPIIYSVIVYWSTGLMASASKFLIYVLICTISSHNAISVAYWGACTFGDEGTAITYIPILVLPMLIFGGFYINYQNIPVYLQPFSYMSWFRYGFEGLQVNQWNELESIEGCSANMTITVNSTYCPGSNGTELLARRGMADGSIWLNVLILLVFLLGYRALGLLSLALRTRFSK